MTRGIPPSRSRTALLDEFVKAGPAGLSLQQAALRATVDIARARTDVSNMRNTRELRRINPPSEREAIYAAHIISDGKRKGLQPLRLPGSLDPHTDRPTHQREKQPPETVAPHTATPYSLAPKAYSSSPAYLPRSTRAAPQSASTHARDCAAGCRNHKATPYTTPELRPYTARPGAMDAYSLPSLQNGTPVQRKPPMSIGAAPQVRTGHWV